MPITKFKRDGLSLPRIARLRKGGEKRQTKAGKSYPGKDLEYFRMDFEPRFAYLADTFMGLYGTEPDVFPGVELCGFTPESAFPHWMEEWGGSVLRRRCDGEMQSAGEAAGQPCASKCNCSGVGRLSFRLPAMEAATGVIGSYLLATTSMYDIAHMIARIESAEALAGTLQGVQFILGREQRQVTSKDKNGKPIATTKSLIYIEIDPQWSAQHLTNSPTHQGAAASTVHWTSNQSRVDDFLVWTSNHFGMGAKDVLIALANSVPYDLVNIEDFRGEEIDAVAAVVASEANFEPLLIQKLPNITENVRNLALSLAAQLTTGEQEA